MGNHTTKQPTTQTNTHQPTPTNTNQHHTTPTPPISPYSDDSIPFQIIANSALQVFSTGNIAPGTLMANTDTRHYLNFTSNIYRFSPAFITPNDTNRFHGINERISVHNF